MQKSFEGLLTAIKKVLIFRQTAKVNIDDLMKKILTFLPNHKFAEVVRHFHPWRKLRPLQSFEFELLDSKSTFLLSLKLFKKLNYIC